MELRSIATVRRHPSYHPAMPSHLFTAVIAILLLAGVIVGEAQQAAKPVTIGVLSALSREWNRAPLEAFRRALHSRSIASVSRKL